jgi:dTDP-4-dehydrorhamnose 3,5-epimerase
MKIIETSLPEVKIIELAVFKDDRGLFMESYNQKTFSEVLGIHERFLQDNHSQSIKNVLRGLHYQIQHPQGKLVRVVSGEAYDVAVDLRKNSPTFGQWVGMHLKSEEYKIAWIPKGFAHGFLSLADNTTLLYKATDFYDPSSEHCLRWNDPDLAIDWPIEGEPLLSKKDRQGKSFKEAVTF